jgi:hypothetical protein
MAVSTNYVVETKILYYIILTQGEKKGLFVIRNFSRVFENQTPFHDIRLFVTGQEFFSVNPTVSHSTCICLSTPHCPNTYTHITLQFLPNYLKSYFLLCFTKQILTNLSFLAHIFKFLI